MRKFFLIILSVALFLVGFYFFWLSPKYTVPILMYHNIGYEDGSSFVKPENFNKQMEYIKGNGYTVITLDELVAGIKNKSQFKKNTVVITFDDGYKDNFVYAYPTLKKFGFPATIFVPSDLIGKEKALFSWNEARIMNRNEISINSHTKTHLYLGYAQDTAATRKEIAGSKKAIEQEIGAPAAYFCYPGGGFNEIVKKLVKEAGYKGACTTNRGSDRFNNDIYELVRVKVTNSDMTKPFSFWVKLSGYYNLLRRIKNSN